MSKVFEDKALDGGVNPGELPVGIPRYLECILALGGLLALSPLFLLCSILVFFGSPGPILFRQLRVGRDGVVFILYKFRTMVIANRGALITADNDNRVTRAGRFLRKTKLDELPEILNVLRGDMSFVGPRPEVPEFANLADPLWQGLLRARPGITDPVTLRLRNEENLLAMVEDKEAYYRDVLQPFKLKGSLAYLKQKSLKGDLKIIAKTMIAIVSPEPLTPAMIEQAAASFRSLRRVTVKRGNFLQARFVKVVTGGAFALLGLGTIVGLTGFPGLILSTAQNDSAPAVHSVPDLPAANLLAKEDFQPLGKYSPQSKIKEDLQGDESALSDVSLRQESAKDPRTEKNRKGTETQAFVREGEATAKDQSIKDEKRSGATATALCGDGTFSYSKTRSGSCSNHGGVADWLWAGSRPAPKPLKLKNAASGKGKYLTGPLGGCFYINSKGKKTYVSRRLCGEESEAEASYRPQS